MSSQRLAFDFFNRPAAVVARELLGKRLVHGSLAAGLVETEAYLARDDLAAHSVQGKKPALEALAKGPGTIYIHPMRGWVGIDLVAADGSVLLRGLDVPKVNGPAKLTTWMDITGALHTRNVTDPACPLWLEEGMARGEIVVGPRVGISKSAGLPLRFLLKQPKS
jgi:DNA-3-methyladenine glycosylase